MIPAWHQLVPISGHVEESETARKLNYTRLPSKHLCQPDYSIEKNFEVTPITLFIFLPAWLYFITMMADWIKIYKVD